MTDVLKIQRQRIPANAGVTAGSKYCVTTPGNCCGTISTLPAGISALKREFTRLYLPNNIIYGPTWCEDVVVCCDAGSGGAVEDPCGTVSIPCCPTKLPTTLTATLTANSQCPCLSGTYSLVWDGTDRWVYSATVCGVGVDLRLQCLHGAWVVWLICDGDALFFTPVTWSCCPLDLSGTLVLNDVWPCCPTHDPGNPAVVTVRITGSGAGTGDGSGGTTHLVRLTKQRIYFPNNVVFPEPYCVTDPDSCCDEDIVTDCCPGPMASTLYLSFLATALCDYLNVTLDLVNTSGLWASESDWPGSVAYVQRIKEKAPFDGTVWCVLGATLVCLPGAGSGGGRLLQLTIYHGQVIQNTDGSFSSSTLFDEIFNFEDPANDFCDRPVLFDFGEIQLVEGHSLSCCDYGSVSWPLISAVLSE